ncbi:hypothetical protein [Mycobacteroides salmoniphilum]|uniref:Uncharacterized protein n=1 Tax=Mycobacteroides salmoniphilum TaxID=404941 RepID=A0A4R8SZT3_9MYCO|nr:hypothetical protein [Mycobacteroides salmoniphilum]TEA09099.1 hypothetical protein CCUG60884_00268 [Mycobacteroides salmoniphilum]
MRYSREYAAWQARAYALVLERAELSPDAVETARCVLRKLALVELDDLTDAEFRAEANNFVQDANHLEISLFRAHYRNRIGLAEEPRDPDSPR